MLRAGALDHRLTIQQAAADDVRDAEGAPTVAWADLATVWGSVQEPSGRRFVEHGMDAAEALTTIQIRYHPAVVAATRKLRVVDDAGRICLVTAPPLDPTGRREELQLVGSRVAR